MIRRLYITHEPCNSNLVVTQLYPFILSTPYDHLLICFNSDIACINTYINIKNINYSWKNIFGNILALWEIIKYKPHLIHLRGYNSSVIIFFYCLFTNTKVIFDPRGAFPEEVKFKNGNLSYFFSRIVEFFIFLLANNVIVVSNKMKKYYLNKFKYLNTKYHVIPTFYNETKPLLKNENKVVSHYNLVYLGSLDKWQCFDKIILFLNRMFKNNIIFTLSIVTSDVLKFENEFKHKLLFTNFNCITLKPDEVPQFLLTQDIALIFREKSIINYVASPVKLQEYLYNRLFVITNEHIGDMSDYIVNKNLGYLVKDFCEINFSEIIKSYNSYIKNGKTSNFHLDYNKEISIKTYVELLKHLSN
jgi:hypothetical protein